MSKIWHHFHSYQAFPPVPGSSEIPVDAQGCPITWEQVVDSFVLCGHALMRIAEGLHINSEYKSSPTEIRHIIQHISVLQSVKRQTE